MNCTCKMLVVIFIQFLSMSASANCPSADLTGDCKVDFADFAVMADQWLEDGVTPLASFLLDTNPDWATEGQWQFGTPTGMGGVQYGYPDPNSGYTGQNVYGVNLNGDYNVAVGGPYTLTVGPFDCSSYPTVELSFARWLNTDTSEYVRCSVEVSNDGSFWWTIWENPADVTIADNQWQKVRYDISQPAAGYSVVFVRWSYQIFHSRAFPFSGWNIDDIELSGRTVTIPDECMTSDDWLRLYLQKLRTAIAQYKAQHSDTLPGTAAGVGFTTAMTSFTDITGAMVSVTKDVANGIIYGPYMLTVPKNSFNNKNSVGIGGTAGDDSDGWEYDSTTGEIHADDTMACNDAALTPHSSL